jgi:hypothetical protein
MIDNISKVLNIKYDEAKYRIKRIEDMTKEFIVECESTQHIKEMVLNESDFKSIHFILKHCMKNLYLQENDCLLEIVLLYYYIMDIFHEDYDCDVIENYFLINDFSNIILKNISSFSNPYFRYNLRKKITY